MERADGRGVSAYCDIVVVHPDVVAITLGTPEAHQAPPLQTPAVNHLVEQPLGVIEDSLSLRTCGGQKSEVRPQTV